MNLRDECPNCGKAVVFVNNSCPACLADRSISPAEFERRQNQAALDALERYAKRRPLSGAIQRLMLGATTVLGVAIVGTAWSPEAVAFSVPGSIVMALLVAAVVFRNAARVDKLRWRRFWPACLVGFWATYACVPRLGSVPVEFGRWPMSFIVASLVALAVGFMVVCVLERTRKPALA